MGMGFRLGWKWEGWKGTGKVCVVVGGMWEYSCQGFGRWLVTGIVVFIRFRASWYLKIRG